MISLGAAPARVQRALLAFAIGVDPNLAAAASYFGTEIDELVSEAVDRGFETDATMRASSFTRF